MARISRDQWEAKGLELFGSDKRAWVFVCPMCGTGMSISKAMAAFPELQGRGWHPESECIGRYLPDQPTWLGMAQQKDWCRWAAYGLFRGPVLVDVGEGQEIPVFDFEGRPFTKKERPESAPYEVKSSCSKCAGNLTLMATVDTVDSVRASAQKAAERHEARCTGKVTVEVKATGVARG